MKCTKKGLCQPTKYHHLKKIFCTITAPGWHFSAKRKVETDDDDITFFKMPNTTTTEYFLSAFAILQNMNQGTFKGLTNIIIKLSTKFKGKLFIAIKLHWKYLWLYYVYDCLSIPSHILSKVIRPLERTNVRKKWKVISSLVPKYVLKKCLAKLLRVFKRCCYVTFWRKVNNIRISDGESIHAE